MNYSIINDPEALRKFATRLNELIVTTDRIFDRISADLEEVGRKDWKDRKYDEFKRAFHKLAETFKEFPPIAKDAIEKLNQRAKNLEDEYLEKKFSQAK